MTIKKMEKYLCYDAGSLEGMLAACTDFKERQNIRSALRELKGIKLDGSTVVTYSFDLDTVKRLSSLSSFQNENDKKLSRQQNNGNSTEENINFTTKRVKYSNTKSSRNGDLHLNRFDIKNEKQIEVNKFEKPKFRSYLYAGSLSAPKGNEDENKEQINGKVKLKQTNCFIDPVVHNGNAFKSVTSRPSSLALSVPNQEPELLTSPCSVFSPSPIKTDSTTSPRSDIALSPRKLESITSPKSDTSPSPRKPRRISYRTSPFSPTSPLSPISSTVSRAKSKKDQVRSESVSLYSKPPSGDSVRNKKEPRRSRSVVENESRKDGLTSPFDDVIRLKKEPRHGRSIFEKDLSQSGKHLISLKTAYLNEKMKSDHRRTKAPGSKVISTGISLKDVDKHEIGKDKERRTKSYGSYLENAENENYNEFKRRTKSDGYYQEYIEKDVIWDENFNKKKTSLSRKNRVDSESPKVLRKFRGKITEGEQSNETRNVPNSETNCNLNEKSGQEVNGKNETVTMPVVKTVRRRLPEIPVGHQNDIEDDETVHQRTLRLLQERRRDRREKLEREKQVDEKTKEGTEEIKKMLEEKLERSDSKRKAYRVRRELQLLNRENALKSPRTSSLSETLGDILSRGKSNPDKETIIKRPVQRSKSDIVRGHKTEGSKKLLSLFDKDDVHGDVFDRVDAMLTTDEPMTPERKINLIGTWMQEEARLQEMLRKSTNFSEKRKMRAEVRKLREQRTEKPKKSSKASLEGSAEIGPGSTIKRSASVTAGAVTHASQSDSCWNIDRTTDQSHGQPSIDQLRKQLSETSDYDEKRKIRLALRQLRQQSRDGSVTQPGLQRSQSFVHVKTTQPITNGDIQSQGGPLITRSQSVTENLRTKTEEEEKLISKLPNKNELEVNSNVSDKSLGRRHSDVLFTYTKPRSHSTHAKTNETNLILDKGLRRSTSDIPARISSSSSDGSGCGPVDISKNLKHLNGEVRVKHAEAGSPPPIVKKRNSLIESNKTDVKSTNSNFDHNKSERNQSFKLRTDNKQSERDERKFSEQCEVFEKGGLRDSEVKIKPKSSNILVSRADIEKTRTVNKPDNFVVSAVKDSTSRKIPETNKSKSELFKSEFVNKSESNKIIEKLHQKQNLGLKTGNNDKRLSPDLLWLEDKRKSLPTPNELDKLMSTMDIEAAFSEILDAVEQFPENSVISEPATTDIPILEEESNESGVESSENMEADLKEVKESKIIVNENKGDANVGDVKSEPNVANEINNIGNAELVESKVKPDINGHQELDVNTLKDDSAILTQDTGIKKSEAQIQLRSTLSLDVTTQPETNGAISVIHGDDGTVTVQEVSKVEDGDTTITEWKKIRRSQSKTETRETDTVIEKKVTSPGGSSSVYEKDVSKTKRKLTSRGSDYFSRNHYNIRRTKDLEGTEIVQHELSTETENMSVTKNESWGDKSEATVILNRADSLKKNSNVEEKLPPTITEDNEEVPKDTNGHNSMLPRRQNSIVKIITDNSEKVVEANLGRPSGCPEVRIPLQAVSVTEEDRVTMECTVMSSPLPTITWFKGDNQLTEGGEIHFGFDRVTGKASLVLDCVKYTDTGDYLCMLENPLGAASTKGRLTVKSKACDPPSFVTTLHDVSVSEGHALILECEVVDADTVSWYKDDIIQRNSADFKQTFDGTMVKMEIGEVFLDDFGTYTCALRNASGEKRCSCKVTVTESESQDDVVPMFLRKPETQIAHEHDIVIIECEVIGSPEPVISWQQDRSKVTEDGRHKMSYDGRVARLIVKNVGIKDGGRMECVAQNSSGRVSADCLLVVKELKTPPVATVPLSDSTVMSSKMAILECQIEGEPTPEIAWHKNGRIIGQMFDFKQTYIDNVARLEIKGVCAPDSGCYECVGTNESGEVTTSCQLTVQDENKQVQANVEEEPRVDTKVTEEPNIPVSPKSSVNIESKARDEPNIVKTPKIPVKIESRVTEGPKVTEAANILINEETIQMATINKFPSRFEPKVEKEQMQASKSQASKVMLVRNASLRNLKQEDREIPLKRAGSLHLITKDKDIKSETSEEIVYVEGVKAISFGDSDTVEFKYRTGSPPKVASVSREKLDVKLDLNKNYTTDINANIAKAASSEEVGKLGGKIDKNKSEAINKANAKIMCSDVKEVKEAKPAMKSKVGGEIRRTQSVRAPASEKPEWLQVKLRRVGGNQTPVLDKEKHSFQKSSEVSSKSSDQPATPLSVHKDIKLSRTQSARVVDRNSSPALKDTTNKPSKNSTKLTPVSERAKIFQMKDTNASSGKSSPSDIIGKAIGIGRTESMRAPVGHRSFGVQRSQSFKTSSQGDVTLELSPQKSQAKEEKGDSGSSRKVVKLWDPTAPSSHKMDYSSIQNEEELNKLLSSSDNFDERKKIRARIKELRDQQMKEWETKRLAREKDSEDAIKKRHREADLEKQKKLDSYKQQTGKHQESKQLALAEQHLRDKHKQADIAKKEQLAQFDTLTGINQDNKALAFEQRQLKEKHQMADVSKQKQLDSYSSVKTELSPDGKTATTTRRVETVTRVGGGAGRPADNIAPELAQQIISAVSPNVSGLLSVKTESWTSKDGQTRTSEKTESWGAKPSPMNQFKQMDAKANPGGARTNLGAGGGRANITRSPSAIKTMLLEWTKAMTREYIDTIEITNFSTSWNDGIAFCALIHHFYPEAFDFKSLDPKQRRKNFELAFDTAEKYADIAPLLDVEDMVRMKKPDWKCVFTYVQSFYRKLKDHDMNKVRGSEA